MEENVWGQSLFLSPLKTEPENSRDLEFSKIAHYSAKNTKNNTETSSEIKKLNKSVIF